MSTSQIIIFDGECNFCNSAVHFIIKRDSEAKFLFTPMQSELAVQLMQQHEVNDLGMDTLLLIKNTQCLTSSSAALEIAKELDGYWHVSSIFKLIPKSIRDFFYQAFARHRYRLFGRRSRCIVPTADIKSRFIGI